MTTGAIKSNALKILDLMNHECWLQNNLAVRGRKFTGKRGLPDIQGFCRVNGKWVACEAKNEGDKLSDDQIELLNNAKKAGCYCFVASFDKKNGFQLKEY